MTTKQNTLSKTGICFALVALVLAVFGQTIHFGFVNFDDANYVYENPAVSKGLSFAGIEWAFTHVVAGHWQPLTLMVHMLDCQIYGLWPGGHHLTNVILHATAVVCLFLLLLEMTRALWRSAFVAAVFSIHPLRVESVAWISECKDVLSGIFFMLTLWAYVRYVRQPERKMRYALVLLWFALGLMSKPMLVTTPCVLLLLDYWPLGRLQGPTQFPGMLREKIPLFILSALSCVAAVLALWMAPRNSSITTYPGNAPVAYAAYIWKLIYPTRLAVLYPIPMQGWPIWDMLNAILLLAALTAGAWLLRRSHPYLVTGWLWYLGMLVPVIGVMQTGDQAYADRYTYLPQIGLCLAGTWLAAHWAASLTYRRAALGGAAVAILCALLIVTSRQITYWRDSTSLWTHTLAVTEDNFIAHTDFGSALIDEGHTAEAIAQFRTALQINPAYPEAHANLGNALLQEGQVEAAVAEFRAALQISPEYAVARNNLGNALLQEGRTEEAIAQFRTVLEADPTYAEVRNNLGNALLQQGRIEDAIAEYREASKIEPGLAKPYNNLGNAFLQQGRIDDAIAELREALRINPGYNLARFHLGVALSQKGEVDEAIAQFRALLQANPQNAVAHYSLANTLLQRGDIAGAVAQYREAVRLNGNYADAYANLGIGLFQQGQTADAITSLEKALALEPDNVSFEGNLAWVLATAPQPALRDGRKALDLATKASQGLGGSNPNILRTLAAAYAETGDSFNALQTAQHALQLAASQSNAALANALNADIKLYNAGRRIGDGR